MHVTNVVRCVWIKRKGEVNLKLKIELDESCRVYAGTEKLNIQPLAVSYTHLDVYKRQYQL